MKLDDIKKADVRNEDGAWVGPPTVMLPSLPGISLRVRGEGNADYEKLTGELWSQVPVEKRDDPKVGDEIEKEVLAKTVLLGWKGVDDAFNPKSVSAFLDIRLARRATVFASRLVASRGVKELEADAKNS